MADDYPPFPDDVPTAPLLTISFRKLLSNDEAEQERLFHASKTLGFFYLDLASCESGEALLESSSSVFELMRDFYELPVEEKKKYDFAAEGSYFGYKGIGAEVVDGKGTRDKNEIYNMSKDDMLSIGKRIPAPEIIDQKRQNIQTYIYRNNSVLEVLFRALASSLKLSADAFSSLHRISEPSGCHARFIRALPQPMDQRSLALGEHTDFGSLTVLFNRIGGLQVLLPSSSSWVYVKPVPGCAIINLGDAMVKFSAGILRSNMHRVVSPPGAQADMVRYSLVYFSRPEHHVKMHRLQGGLIDEVVGSVGAKAGDAEVQEAETTEQWLKRRHQGRKIQFFKGEESWQKAIGTETVK